MESISFEKKLAKTSKKYGFSAQLCKNGVPMMGHAQNKKQFFVSERIKPDPKLSKTFYFNKIPNVFDWVMNIFLYCVMLFC